MKKSYLLASVCAAALVFGSSVGFADEDKDKGVRGKVTAVDAEAKTVTVETKDKESHTLNVTDDTKIKVGDKEGSLSDLKEGHNVNVKKDGDQVKAITVRSDDGKPKREKTPKADDDEDDAGDDE